MAKFNITKLFKHNGLRHNELLYSVDFIASVQCYVMNIYTYKIVEIKS